MKRVAIWAGVLTLGGIAAWQAVAQNQSDNASNTAEPVAEAAPAPKAATPPPALPVAGKETPMAERVATLGILNKRNGLYRDLSLKPGQGVRIGDLIVKLKACETTAPWEPETWTGSFVQVIVLGSDERWRRYFSGWLYKESPSLNVVEHPIYDVWTKACQMRHPDVGPETLVVRGGETASSSGRRSSAPKSDEEAATPAVVPTADNASANVAR